MYAPAQDDEAAGTLGYLRQQLDAIRAATYGLTEEQARSTPCRSALSVVGIVKHVTYGMRGATRRLREGPPAGGLDGEAFAAYQGSFVPAERESTEHLLDEFDAARDAYLEAVAATDPDAEGAEPPAPWHGVFSAQPIRMRFYLQHQVEEMARHAGHADILREELDGMSVPALVLTLEGAPANDFFTPFVPAPGTIGAEVNRPG